MEFTHFNTQGHAKMVNVGEKQVTKREAIAKGEIHLAKETVSLVQSGGTPKGDVLSTAQIAGIMAAKNTSAIIPMCHNIMLEGVDIVFELDPEGMIGITCTVATTGKTGAEMEALTAVSVCALTVYDMCKAVDKGMHIENIRLVRKTGGKSDREGK